MNSKSGTMRRFVVLQHDHPELHWDLFLDTGETLRAWRLLSDPGQLPARAEQGADHRRVYLDYEGPVSGDRGSVKGWDKGRYRILECSKDRLTMDFAGEQLVGVYTLQREQDDWKFDKLRDPTG